MHQNAGSVFMVDLIIISRLNSIYFILYAYNILPVITAQDMVGIKIRVLLLWSFKLYDTNSTLTVTSVVMDSTHSNRFVFLFYVYYIISAMTDQDME